MMKLKIEYIVLILIFVLTACNAWDESADVSEISYIPTFELEGGQYLSYMVNELDTFIDPGAKAYENGEEISVYTYGDTTVHPDKEGLYVVVYYTYNSYDMLGVEYRYISITSEDVTQNDLSGDYTGTIWSPQVEMKVTKLNDKGYYKCGDVMGYPGAEMKGQFVDLGKHKLILLPGEGYFGKFAASEGAYTLSTLSWTIKLISEPYDGIAIDVAWYKNE